jgi:hypothetical protein
LQSIENTRALPSIEKVFSIENAAIGLRLVEVIGNMPSEEAAASLVRLAVQSPDSYVRERAATALKSYPEHSYVPLLISGLAAPIEMSVDTSVEPGSLLYEPFQWSEFTGRVVVGMYDKIRLRTQYSRADVLIWTLEEQQRSGLKLSGYRPNRIQHNYLLSRDSPDPDRPYEYSGTIDDDSGPSKSAQNIRSIEDLEKKVEQANAATALLNERIHAALSNAIGANGMPDGFDAGQGNIEIQPRLWWDWWKKRSRANNYFAQGTEVWTQCGPVPIQDILVGDRVLTRAPASDELSFNLVVGIDMRPKSAARIIEVASRTIVATPEQTFFVTNVGWRKASELKPGMQLDCLKTPARIEKVNSGEAPAIYSLVVSDVPNYFVDRRGVFVQDATGR